MPWATLECSRQDVNAAGAALIAPQSPPGELERALGVINNWRACHAFPLNTFQMNLRAKTKQVDKQQGLVAQRIKRLGAIEFKLRHMPNLRLTQMQDVGGCRAVVRSIRAVNGLHELYRQSSAKHRFLHRDDYIQMPRATGYRGIHLIYRYYSDKNTAYNGLRIEMQLRTRLQHAWATAVETVGAFKAQALKSGIGDEQWLRFFALMGSVLAFKEKTPRVRSTPADPQELARELRYYVDELDVVGNLSGYRVILDAVPRALRHIPFFLLELNPREGHLQITPYTRRDAEIASERYMMAERQGRLRLSPESEPERDRVLVSTESLKVLRSAYPNYFADTRRFVREVIRAVEA